MESRFNAIVKLGGAKNVAEEITKKSKEIEDILNTLAAPKAEKEINSYRKRLAQIKSAFENLANENNALPQTSNPETLEQYFFQKSQELNSIYNEITKLELECNLFLEKYTKGLPSKKISIEQKNDEFKESIEASKDEVNVVSETREAPGKEEAIKSILTKEQERARRKEEIAKKREEEDRIQARKEAEEKEARERIKQERLRKQEERAKAREEAKQKEEAESILRQQERETKRKQKKEAAPPTVPPPPPGAKIIPKSILKKKLSSKEQSEAEYLRAQRAHYEKVEKKIPEKKSVNFAEENEIRYIDKESTISSVGEPEKVKGSKISPVAEPKEIPLAPERELTSKEKREAQVLAEQRAHHDKMVRAEEEAKYKASLTDEKLKLAQQQIEEAQRAEYFKAEVDKLYSLSKELETKLKKLLNNNSEFESNVNKDLENSKISLNQKNKLETAITSTNFEIEKNTRELSDVLKKINNFVEDDDFEKINNFAEDNDFENTKENIALVHSELAKLKNNLENLEKQFENNKDFRVLLFRINNESKEYKDNVEKNSTKLTQQLNKLNQQLTETEKLHSENKITDDQYEKIGQQTSAIRGKIETEKEKLANINSLLNEIDLDNLTFETTNDALDKLKKIEQIFPTIKPASFDSELNASEKLYKDFEEIKAGYKKVNDEITKFENTLTTLEISVTTKQNEITTASNRAENKITQQQSDSLKQKLSSFSFPEKIRNEKTILSEIKTIRDEVTPNLSNDNEETIFEAKGKISVALIKLDNRNRIAIPKIQDDLAKTSITERIAELDKLNFLNKHFEKYKPLCKELGIDIAAIERGIGTLEDSILTDSVIKSEDYNNSLKMLKENIIEVGKEIKIKIDSYVEKEIQELESRILDNKSKSKEPLENKFRIPGIPENEALKTNINKLVDDLTHLPSTENFANADLSVAATALENYGSAFNTYVTHFNNIIKPMPANDAVNKFSIKNAENYSRRVGLMFDEANYSKSAVRDQMQKKDDAGKTWADTQAENIDTFITKCSLHLIAKERDRNNDAIVAKRLAEFNELKQKNAALQSGLVVGIHTVRSRLIEIPAGSNYENTLAKEMKSIYADEVEVKASFVSELDYAKRLSKEITQNNFRWNQFNVPNKPSLPGTLGNFANITEKPTSIEDTNAWTERIDKETNKACSDLIHIAKESNPNLFMAETAIDYFRTLNLKTVFSNKFIPEFNPTAGMAQADIIKNLQKHTEDAEIKLQNYAQQAIQNVLRSAQRKGERITQRSLYTGLAYEFTKPQPNKPFKNDSDAKKYADELASILENEYRKNMMQKRQGVVPKLNVFFSASSGELPSNNIIATVIQMVEAHRTDFGGNTVNLTKEVYDYEFEKAVRLYCNMQNYKFTGGHYNIPPAELTGFALDNFSLLVKKNDSYLKKVYEENTKGKVAEEQLAKQKVEESTVPESDKIDSKFKLGQ